MRLRREVFRLGRLPATRPARSLRGRAPPAAESPLVKPVSETITPQQFDDVDMRVGRIVSVDEFPEARVPAWKLRIDFGPELGVRSSSARITNYTRADLEGALVVGVVNFPPKQIGPVRSEVLVLGAVDENGLVLLLRPDGEPALGSRIA